MEQENKQEILDRRYMRMARIWAENSYCKRRQVGALIVKDKEANAITKIARSNNSSEDATMYVTTSPCIECAKLIIQAGIKRLVYGEKYRLEDGLNLLRKAGIEVVYLENKE